MNRLSSMPLLLLALGVLWIAGCNKQPPAATQPAAKPADRSAEKGPVRLMVHADRTSATVGESIRLSIDVLAEADVAIEMPTLEATLGPFDVLNQQSPPDIPDNGKRRWNESASLRTLEAGDVSIPAITVKFHDRRKTNPNGEIIDGELSTDPIPVVISTLQPGKPDAKNMRDIKGEVAIAVPDPGRVWRWVIGTAAAIIAIAAALWVAFRLRRPKAVVQAPPLPAHVWAMQELDRLAASGLVERGDLHGYFFRLSEIVRQYIERRFGIMAAEQTTEEFLGAARHSHALSDDHRTLLGSFLRLSDMVKFAKFQPARDDTERAFAAAGEFVKQTAETHNSTGTAAHPIDHAQPKEAAA